MSGEAVVIRDGQRFQFCDSDGKDANGKLVRGPEFMRCVLAPIDEVTTMISHCDDLIEDETQPACLRVFLEFNRRPAIKKIGKSPALFAILKNDAIGQVFEGHDKNGPIIKQVPLRAGQHVRVVMASRFGDVGVTPDLVAEHGYVLRVPCSDLENFTDCML